MKLVERALSFTIRAHDGQYRKHDKDTPYVFHPMVVSLILKRIEHGLYLLYY